MRHKKLSEYQKVIQGLAFHFIVLKLWCPSGNEKKKEKIKYPELFPLASRICNGNMGNPAAREEDSLHICGEVVRLVLDLKNLPQLN